VRSESGHGLRDVSLHRPGRAQVAVPPGGAPGGDQPAADDGDVVADMHPAGTSPAVPATDEGRGRCAAHCVPPRARAPGMAPQGRVPDRTVRCRRANSVQAARCVACDGCEWWDTVLNAVTGETTRSTVDVTGGATC
jgi:hypothetical protein